MCWLLALGVEAGGTLSLVAYRYPPRHQCWPHTPAGPPRATTKPHEKRAMHRDGARNLLYQSPLSRQRDGTSANNPWN